MMPIINITTTNDNNAAELVAAREGVKLEVINVNSAYDEIRICKGILKVITDNFNSVSDKCPIKVYSTGTIDGAVIEKLCSKFYGRAKFMGSFN